MIPKIQAKPKRMKMSTVATLIMDSQNSDSAKARVELRFEIKTPLAKINVHNQIDVCGNHSCTKMAAAVNSVLSVADQPSQYIHDTI